jgi:hypothetical protein
MRHVLVLLLAGLATAEEPWVIGSAGADLRTETAQKLTRPIHFERPGPGGMVATFIPRSLRGSRIDDMRNGQPIGGTRLDATVDQPKQAFGTEEERLRFGIGGGPGDWDNFSVQWDGLIQLPATGADLATSSDDGSRVWIDRNRDGICQAEEWGSNGWGGGQGTTLRQVHAAIPAGTWPIRIQFEEGGGGNACTFLWRHAGTGGGWQTVPAQAFARTPVLSLAGPVTVHSTFSGPGELRCSDGVRLVSLPTEGSLVIAGDVALAADVSTTTVHIARDAMLRLAGHRMAVTGIVGNGAVQLDGGTLQLAQAGDLAVRGSGRLVCTGNVALDELDAAIKVELAKPGAAVRSPGRSVVSASLEAPLATVLELGRVPEDHGTLEIEIDGPLHGAGLVVWRADRHGRWFQRIVQPELANGPQRLTIDVSASAPLLPVGHQAAWNPATEVESQRVGLLVYADRPLQGQVQVDARWRPFTAVETAPQLTAITTAPAQVRTGQRIELSARPEPFPAWPLDQDNFALDLAVTAPNGDVIRYAGFVDQPFRRVDRGDREDLLADGPPCFTVRWRARMPGPHRLRLEARWAGGGQAVVDLPEVLAEGPAWDDIARVDAVDPRFLSSHGAFVWPIGQNLNSTYDVRSRGAMSTKLTPNRGTFVREALLERLAAAGGTGGETWLSPWNLGLEWTDAWPGYHGAGRPNLGNAWALDCYLDLAERRGMRIVLSIFNHGQGRDGSGAEDDWPYHPLRAANGGWLDGPPGLFTDERALRRQANLFRYLAARWGDSPALLCWKLWAEVNLVHVPIEAVRTWHAGAAEMFARFDPWRHPVTTHWCGDWHNPDPVIAALPGMDMLTIDAYHGEGTMIAELLGQSTRPANRDQDGLWRYAKPVLVTEYGGSAGGCSSQRMEAEHAIGGWAAFVHGHAGAPMLWWFEWIDQGARYAPFGALSRFTAGEDLRNPLARTAALGMRGSEARLWCRAWQRPGRMLGYAVDSGWAVQGGEAAEQRGAILDAGSVSPGAMTLQWWDADLGIMLQSIALNHTGGQLLQPVPAFRRHIAFKLWRNP